jgi:hypothetical protein
MKVDCSHPILWGKGMRAFLLHGVVCGGKIPDRAGVIQGFLFRISGIRSAGFLERCC